MKKIAAYFAIGILSSVFTLGALWLVNQYNQNSGDGLIANEEAESAFQFADFKGNYAINTPDFVKAADKSVHAVVSIKNYSTRSVRQGMTLEDLFFGTPSRGRSEKSESLPNGLGSGVIISEDGYVVTNNHVIDGADKLEVVLNNQKTYVAKLVGTDPNTDIALLKIDENNLPFLKFVDSDGIYVGDWVLAVGNPFGLSSTVTAGIVSAKGRSIDILRQKGQASSPIESFIQTDAAINPGNSGGALVNPNGDLVGINTAISSRTGSYIGYGFAVPSNLAKKVVEDIKQYGLVQRGYLGINGFDLSDEEMLSRYNEEYGTKLKKQAGVLVTGLLENGAALKAGIEEDDIIKKVDGKEVKDFASLSFLVGSRRPGDQVTVEVLRDNTTKNYRITLLDQKGSAKARKRSELTYAERLGANFSPLTERQRTTYGIDYGMVVSEVDPSGKLAGIGMRDGYIILEVNGKKVDSEKAIEREFKKGDGKISIDYIDPYGRVHKRGLTMD